MQPQATRSRLKKSSLCGFSSGKKSTGDLVVGGATGGAQDHRIIIWGRG